MGEEGEKLIFGGVRTDQFLTERDISGFIFHKIEDALNGLLRILQAKQINVHEASHAAEILEGLLNELKGNAECEHLFQRFRGSDFHLFKCGVLYIGARWQLAETLCHLRKR